MDNDDDATLAVNQRYKAAVHYTVGKICEEVGQEKSVTFSRQFISVMAEATNQYIASLGTDLELFARHGKRSIVNQDDVKMCVRKSPRLMEYLVESCPPEPKKSRTTGGGKKRSTAAPQADTGEDSNM